MNKPKTLNAAAMAWAVEAPPPPTEPFDLPDDRKGTMLPARYDARVDNRLARIDALNEHYKDEPEKAPGFPPECFGIAACWGDENGQPVFPSVNDEAARTVLKISSSRRDVYRVLQDRFWLMRAEQDRLIEPDAGPGAGADPTSPRSSGSTTSPPSLTTSETPSNS